ncbi:MAG: T9SS type A sorting domain-containing protein [Bacteroidia bacterium]
MKSKLPFILIAILILSGSKIFSQAPQWLNYTAGYFPNKIVVENNYAWAATESGLVRIDRTTGSTMVYNRANSALIQNDVKNIVIDNAGSKWMNTYTGGLMKLDSNNNWTLYEVTPSGDTILGCLGLKVDKSGNVYTLYFYQPAGFPNYKTCVAKISNGVWSYLYPDTVNTPIFNFNSFALDTSDNIIVNDYTHIEKWDGNLWSTVNLNTVPGSLYSHFQNIIIDKENNFWFSYCGNVGCTSYNLYKYDGVSWNVYYPGVTGLNNSSPWELIFDSNNQLWIPTGTNGIIKYDGTTWSQLNSTNSVLPTNNIYCLAVMSNNDWWFSSWDWNSSSNYVLTHFDGSSLLNYSVAGNGLTSDNEDQLKIDKNGNKWIVDKGEVMKFDGFSWLNKGGQNYPVYDIEIEDSDKVWLCIYDGDTLTPPLEYFDGTTWTPITINYPQIYSAHSMCIDSSGNKWITAESIVIKFDGVNWTYFDNANSPFNWLDPPINIEVDINQNIWVITYNNHLAKYDGVSWMVYNIPSSIVLSTNFLCDHSGNIWISGTNEILKFDGASWTTFNSSNSGYPGSYSTTIAEDIHHHIWMGGGYPIQKFTEFDGNTWTIHNFFNSSSLMNYGVEQMSFDHFGNLWMRMFMDGIAVYNPNGITNVGALNDYFISGNVFFDANTNGIKDTNETGVTGQKILLLPDSEIVFSSTQGNYKTYVEAGNFVLQQQPYNNWYITSDSLSFQVNIDSTNKSGYDFGITPFSTYPDLNVHLTGGQARCNTNQPYWIDYRNTGTQTVDGLVSFIPDTAILFQQCFPSPSFTNGDTLFFQFSNLLPFQQRQIYFLYEMPDVNGINDSLHSIVKIDYLNGTVLTNLYSDTLNQVVTCSYDPNEKTVSPPGVYWNHFTLMTDTLEFTIHFQNLGNDTAFTVTVRDTLDSDLDLNTFEIISYSHPANVSITADGVATFTLNNIQLPGYKTNEPGSQGFVKYRIAPKQNLPDPTPIINRAYIYFDFNPTVITNITINTLVNQITPAMGIADINVFDKVKVFPNPFSSETIIHFPNPLKEKYMLHVYNVFGQEIMKQSIQSNEIVVDGNNLKSALYFFNLEGKTSFKGKFVVNH